MSIGELSDINHSTDSRSSIAIGILMALVDMSFTPYKKFYFTKIAVLTKIRKIKIDMPVGYA